jgi:amidase
MTGRKRGEGWRGSVLVLVAVAVAAMGPAAPAVAAVPGSIAKLERSLASGRTTCAAVVRSALDRVRAVNPATHAVIETNPDAMAIARRLDARQQAGRRLGRLHCVPVLLKANYGSADRMQTTAGSVVMRGFRTREDAFATARLRRHGAVPIAKTNMDEWAHGIAGYSSLGGQTANGLRANRGPSGSSGGSASGVASGMALVGMGSDTGGSIQGPASWNGVVGIRPTVGLISRAGVIPFASFTDVLGPMTRSVADLARVLGPLTGVDPADPATRASRSHADYTRFLDRDGLRGARIGVVRSLFTIDLTADSPEVDAAFDRAVTRVRRSGATVVDGLGVDVPGYSFDGVGLITASQFHAELDEWFRGPGRGAPVGSLAEVVQRSAQPGVRERVLVFDALEHALAQGPPGGPEFDAAVLEADRLRDTVLDLMRRHRLDALMYPTMTCAAPPLPGVVDPSWTCTDSGESFPQPLKLGEAPGAFPTILSPLSRLPALTLPAGRLAGGLRLGVNLLGPAWSEGRLIRLGHAFERGPRRR